MEMKEEEASGAVVSLSSRTTFQNETLKHTAEAQDTLKFNIFTSDSCNIDCVRDKMRQKLQIAMRTLRKSINKQQFYIQFSGTEYEVAQKPSRITEGADTCSTGQVFQDGKCGGSGLRGAVLTVLCLCEN